MLWLWLYSMHSKPEDDSSLGWAWKKKLWNVPKLYRVYHTPKTNVCVNYGIISQSGRPQAPWNAGCGQHWEYTDIVGTNSWHGGEGAWKIAYACVPRECVKNTLRRGFLNLSFFYIHFFNLDFLTKTFLNLTSFNREFVWIQRS